MISHDIYSDVESVLAPIGDAKPKSESSGVKFVTADTEVANVSLTDGELLPWKGRWWRVKLHQVPQISQPVIELKLVKPTGKALKTARLMGR